MTTFSGLLLGFILRVLLPVVVNYVVVNGDLCSATSHCFHNQSGLCSSIKEKPLSCNHLLKSEKNVGVQCQIERNEPLDCYIEAPSYVSGPHELPFVMQMYYYRTWMGARAVVNLTFPTPAWDSAKFQYQSHDNQSRVLCRKFSLKNVRLPLVDDLMWDCPFFESPIYLNRSFDLSIITSNGIGGKYTFRVPENDRFDPVETKLEDWQVFFFIHSDHLYNSAYLPVTVQLVPFNDTRISYNISLSKCLQDEDNCDQRSTLETLLIKNPQINATTVGDTKQITQLLPYWSNPGTYIVSVQVVSPNCTNDGCFISLSPVFAIRRSQTELWLSVAFVLFVMFTFAYVITLHHRTKENKKLLTSIKYNQPSVLLLYLPENKICLELVEMFASFLKEKCYVHPYVIDSDVGSKNPNSWISEHMHQADRLLFIVPGNPKGISITPRRDQWLSALKYFSGEYFFTNHGQRNAAVVLLPFSADVPYEIGNVRRFNIVSEMPSLVTWIHGGTWWDRKLLWSPEIRSKSKSSSAPSLENLLKIVNQASQVTKCHKGVGNKVLHGDRNLFKNADFTIDSVSPVHAKYSQHSLSDTEDSRDTNSTSDCGKEFDPDIADAEELMERGETINVDENDDYSENSSDLDDDYFL